MELLGWRSKSTKIEVINTNYTDDAWTTKYTNTAQTKGNLFVTFNHTPVGASNGGGGFNKIRFTFSDWASSTIFRIAQLGLLMYGSIGLRETNMSRGIDDPVFRNITPNKDAGYSLGSTTKRWLGHFKNLVLYGNAADKPLITRGVSGSDGNGNDGPLYLNYGTSQPVHFGNDGGYTISADGSTYSGNSATATKLKTPRTINGTSFDGSKDITITATDPNAIPITQKGAANGVAELDENGLVLSSQLPSYVDDILEYSAKSSFPSTGETGKIYVDTSTNLTYRWSGSAYVEISPSLALGTTSSTAYRGDYGNTAYTHATAKGSAFSSGFYKITTNAQGHVTSVTAVTKADITALGIPDSDADTTYTFATGDSNGQIKVTPSNGDASNISVKGLAAGAYKAIDTSISASSTSANIPTSAAVATFVEGKGYKKIDGSSKYITLTGGDGNTTGYRLILQETFTTWKNCRMVISIASRHQGTGILSIGISTGSTISEFYQDARIFGANTSYTSDSWIQYYNSETGVYSLFWKYNDYSTCNIDILEKTGFINAITNGTWMTSIDTEVYGTKYSVYLNKAQGADSATKDGSGNVIANTYVKKSGDTITGDLTVEGTITADNGIIKYTDSAQIQYNSTDECFEFIFN